MARNGSRTYAGRGNVCGVQGCAPTVTAHLAKNRDEGLVLR